MGVDICYIISHGFAARMLLQTNLIEKLADQGIKIGLITPDSSDENLKVFEENPNIQLVQWDSKATIWDDNYLSKRMYYLEDVDKNTALKEKFWSSLFC